MKLATATILLSASSALAFAPQKAAFRPASSLFATEAATEKKVRFAPLRWIVVSMMIDGGVVQNLFGGTHISLDSLALSLPTCLFPPRLFLATTIDD